MTTFLILTVFAIIGISCLAKVLFVSIQPGEWIDTLLGWQYRLERIGHKTGGWNTILYKIGGGCSFCFAHFIALLGFVVFAAITCINGYWPLFETTVGQWVFNFGFYFLFVPTSTVIGSLVINRL